MLSLSKLLKKSQVVYLDKILSIILLVLFMIFLVETFQLLQEKAIEQNDYNTIEAFIRLNRVNYVLLDKGWNYGAILGHIYSDEQFKVYCYLGKMFLYYGKENAMSDNWLNMICLGKGKTFLFLKTNTSYYLFLYD